MFDRGERTEVFHFTNISNRFPEFPNGNNGITKPFHSIVGKNIQFLKSINYMLVFICIFSGLGSDYVPQSIHSICQLIEGSVVNSIKSSL